ncbi:MAG: HIT domain-containing protein [Magnetovibrionaceae bacterium]
MSFTLDPQLEKDTDPVIDLSLCRVLLAKDKRWPWLILVPMREGLVDVVDLEGGPRKQLSDEIDRASLTLKALYGPYKLNVASLGNMVRQLHVHVIARNQGDEGWPGPIWGVGEPAFRTPNETAVTIAKIKDRL